MDQYHPCGTADKYEELRRTLTGAEYRQALEIAQALGLSPIDRPDFSRLLQWPGT